MIYEYRDFNAIHDFMPGKGHPLRVTGTCCFTTSGWTARLEASDRFDSDVNVLTLDLIFDGPESEAADVISCVDVRYEVETDIRYRGVEFQVHGDGDQPPLPIAIEDLEIGPA